MPTFSEIAKNAKKIKEQIADQAGLSTKDVNDKNLTEASKALQGAQQVSSAGQDPTAVDFSKLKEAGSGEQVKDKPEDLSRQQKLAFAITAIAPTLLGYTFGGAEGGAIGANVSGKAIDTMAKEDAENRKSAREQAEKKELNASNLAAKAEENEKDRKSREEIAKMNRDSNASQRALANEMTAARLQEMKDKKEHSASMQGRLEKLGAEGKQRLDNAKMGLNAVQGMADALRGGDNTFSVWGDNDFTQQRGMFEEALGRMQSGGAISKEEETRFKNMAPTFRDTPEMRAKKLKLLQSEFANRIGTLGFNPEEVGIKISDVSIKPKASVKNPALPSANAAQEPDWHSMTPEQLEEYLKQ